MRTIDADAALKALRKCQTYLYDARDPELKIELSSAEAAIKELPTIQPEKAQLSQEGITKDATSDTIQSEPQEGHWIRTDCGLDVECKCSKCGYRDFVEPRDEYWFKRNYCPNCGAKMTISTK